MVKVEVSVDFKNTAIVAQNEYLLEIIQEVARRLDTFGPDVAVVGTCHLLLMRASDRVEKWDEPQEEADDGHDN